ncbi:aromatic motif membrane protein [Mycoplasmopsis gallopavonis]|uniref:Aromatic cluster surface protein n=1 Tax=Mycoplasmopsis gallopavonis TaxID=76629 RepID=A0A449B047_9BACT|nr:aromatic motif membrane protein [Mycoplasmopsis gallopavonis]RIV16383.1 hypothetical protein D1113_02580 [Mycoplasmopsis gallopavonis]VEU73114.1 Uncharacterised protein [Mycoplasmopsis gallopavonis]
MKKLSRNKKILIIALTSLGLLSIASATSVLWNNKIQNSAKKEFQKSFQSQIDPHLKNLVNWYFDDDQNQINDFYTTEQQNNDLLLKELKSTLILAPLWDVSVIDKAGDKEKQVYKSINLLKNIIKNNWFWFLNNLDKFQFLYNPYGAMYSDDYPTSPKDILTKIQTKISNNETLLINNSTKKIQNIYEFEVPDTKYDVWSNKKILFFQLGQNKFIPLLKFNKENKKYLQVLPEMLVMHTTIKTKDALQKFLNAALVNNLKIQNDYIEYQMKLQPDFNIEDYKRDSNDQYYFSIFDGYNYSESFKNAINQIQTEGIIMERYTWGYINEK